MKIIFFGTPEFSVPFLEHLIDDPEMEVVAVVCQSDKPVGRKQELSAPAVKRTAMAREIPVFQFETLRDPSVVETLKTFNADAFVLVVYGNILPQAVLDIAPLGIVNVHPSLLPKYRGPSPMKTAILKGETQTGISIMLLDAGMDTGPVLTQQIIAIDSRETNTTLENKVMAIGPDLLVQTLKAYARGDIKPTPQDDTLASVTNILNREDGRIDWKRTPVEIDRQVRAMEPWPGTWTTWKGQRLKILETAVIDDGRLDIIRVQVEGKQSQSMQAFVNGHPDFKQEDLT